MALTQISTQGIKDGTITGSDLATNIDLVDNQKLRLGAEEDLQIFHAAGAASHINATGLLNIDGTTGVRLEYNNATKLEITSSGVDLTGSLSVANHITLPDQASGVGKIKMGDGVDFQLYHNGTNSVIENRTGSLLFYNNTNELAARFVPNGAVDLYHDNSKKFETTSSGVSITNPSGVGTVQITGFEGNGAKVVLIADEGDDNGDTWELQSHATSNNLNFRNDSTGSSVVKWNLTTDGDVTQTGHLDLPDSKQLRFGNGDDLQIYHDGSDSYISNVGTGELIIQPTTNEIAAVFRTNGSVELFHDNSKKFETTSVGASIPDSGNQTASSAHTTGALFCNLIRPVTANNNSYTGTYFMNRNAVGEGIKSVGIVETGLRVGDFTSDLSATEKIKLTYDGHIEIKDNGKLKIGNSNDLQIFHNTAGGVNRNDIIAASGTGLKLQTLGNNILELSTNSETSIICRPDGATELFHNGTKQMETSSGGASIRNHHKFDTGTVTQRSYLSSGNGVNHRIMLAGAGTSNIQGQYIRAFANCANINDSGTVKFVIFATGDCQNANNSFAGFSDVNLKQDITDASSQWDDIKNLKVRKYRFKNNPTGPLQIGCIAQEAETVSPGLIDTDPEEGFKSLKYSVLYMKGIKCLQEAMARIEALETEVAALKAA